MDVIIGADVVYSTEAVAHLFNAVDALLKPTPTALFLLAYIPRWPAVDEVRRAFQRRGLGLGLRRFALAVQGGGFGVQGSRPRVQGLRFRIREEKGAGSRERRARYRVELSEGLAFRF